MRTHLTRGLGPALLAAVLTGCAAPDPKPASRPVTGSQPNPTVQPTSATDANTAWEARARQLENEKATLQRGLDEERAQRAALEQRANSASGNTDTNRAEISALKQRIDQLTQQNAALIAAAEQRAQRPPERPQVAATTLPADVDSALQAFANKYAGRVWYDRSRGAVSFANDRLFDSGNDAVRADALPPLGEFAELVGKTVPSDYEVVIVGHTDDAPISQRDTLAKHPTNWHLSVHRAIAVKNVLAARGLPEARLGVMGYGALRPVSDDKARNRRVEIFLVRRGDVQNFAPVRAAGQK